jgi:hypothetical protein
LFDITYKTTDSNYSETFIILYELFDPLELIEYIDEYIQLNEDKNIYSVLGTVIAEHTNPNLERID